MKIRFTMLFLLVCLLMCINALCAQDFVSSNPRYAAIVLPEFSPKGILVIFDESAGTGKGYNTVYVDVNLDGKIGSDEKFSDESDQSAENFIYIIDPVMIQSDKQMNVSYEVAFRMSKQKATDRFDISVFRDTQHEGRMWSIKYGVSIKPSNTAKKPFIFKPIRIPKAVVTASTSKKVTGLAISLVSGGVGISSPSFNIDLSIKNRSGKTIKKVNGKLDQFKLERENVYQYSLRLAPGKYTLFAIINTGPVAKIVNAKKNILVPR
ncbi:MAG: hypothetical protein ACYC0V_09350 [Armatimonadota bacterium]